MKSVLVIIALLSLAHYAMASSCSAIPQYTAYLKPACAANDTSIFWPNYENFKQYYRCRGVGNPVLTDCLVDTYFSFPLQICTPCDRFLPAPACEHLSTENPAVCLPIQSSTIATPTAAPNSPTTPSTPAATENPNIPRYNTTFIPACEANDVDLLWPNYENFSEYYKCQKVGGPVIGHCAADNYFSFYWQVCTTIDKFLPAPLCENLSTQSPPVCVPIGSTTLAPTDAPADAPTAAPTDVPTVAPTNAPTAVPTNAPTAAPTNAPTAAPTDAPTAAPTNAPTAAPTEAPTAAPTDAPTAAPTESVNTPPPNIPTPPVIG